MSHLAEFLTTHGPSLLIGATVLLASGAAAMLLSRWPVHRQRIGEAALLGTLLWLALACVPLPRLSPGVWWSPAPGGETPSNDAEAAVFQLPVADASTLDQHRNSSAIDIDIGASEPPEFVAADFTPAPPPALAEAESAVVAVQTDIRPGPESNVDRPPPVNSTAVPDALAGAPDDAATAASSAADSRSEPESAGPHRAASLLPYVYLAGAAGAVGWLALGQFLLIGALRRCRPADERLRRIYDELTFAEGRRRPRLLVSGTLARPISCGMLRPAIVLPDYGRDGQSATWLRHVLLHELAHHRRRDAWSHWLFNLALPVLYFHPLYWHLRGSVELSRELLADDWAARHTSPVQYADEMIALARRRGLGRSQLNVVGVFSSPSQFYRRMSMLVQREQPLSTRCSLRWRAAAGLICAAVVTTAAGLSGVRYTAADEPEQPYTDAAAVISELVADENPHALAEASQLPPDNVAEEVQTDSYEAIVNAVQNELAATEETLAALNTQYETLMLAMETTQSAKSETVQHEIRIIHDTIANLRREQLDIGRALRELDSQIAVTEAEIRKAELPRGRENVTRKEISPDPQYAIELEIHKQQKAVLASDLAKNKLAIAAEQEKLKKLGVASADLEQVMRDINSQSEIAANQRQLLAELSAAAKTEDALSPSHLLEMIEALKQQLAERDERLSALANQQDERRRGPLASDAAAAAARVRQVNKLLELQSKQAQLKQAELQAELAKANQQLATHDEALAAQLAALQEENALLKTKLLEVAQNAERSEEPKPAIAQQPAQAGSGAAAQLTGTGSTLDLIGLANNYAEAIAEQEVAQVDIEIAVENAEQKVGGRAAVKVAEIRHRAAHNKARLLRGIVETLLEAADKEHAARLEHAQRLNQLGKVITTSELRAAQQSVAQARVNIEILQLILKTD